MSFCHTLLCKAPEFRLFVVMQGVAVCFSVQIELQQDAGILPCVAVCCRELRVLP